MRRLVPRAARLAVLAVAVFAWLPSGAQANAPALSGAATHPLWSSSSVADFDRELDLLREAGASSVRIGIGWSSLEETGKGVHNQGYVQKADTFFEHARARGLRVIVTFWETPCWASSAPAELKQDCAGAWWDRGVTRYPPAQPADFADAAAWVAARWGRDMAALEIWNEPNFKAFFQSAAPNADYAALLRAAYPRIKGVAPDLPVLGAAMLGSDLPFLEGLYSAGIRGYYDAISSHPYSAGADPRDTSSSGTKYSFLLGVPKVREAMVAHGDGDKKLWFTELGWSSCGPGGTSSWCVTPETQARYVADAFRIIRDCWDFVHSVSVYNLRNTGTSATDRESQMGLLLNDFTPKPSYSAFKNVLAELRSNPGAPPPAAGTPACGGPAQAPPAASAPAAAAPAASAPVAAAPAPAVFPPVVPGPAVAKDRVAPTLRGLSLRPTRLRRGARARIAWSLSEPARVSFRLEGLRGRASRWVRLRGSFGRSGALGANGLSFAGRLRGRLLVPGRYRVVALARDGAGNVSAPARTAFRIVR